MNIESIVLHWIYVIVMLTGSTIIFFMSRKPKNVPKIEYFIAFIIPIWSALAYMAMALEQGIVEIGNQVTYYSRYLDWVVTTPLLLLSLSLAAMYKIKKDKVLIASLMIADIIMVISGLIADLSLGVNRYIWFSIGMFGFIVSLYIIWVPYMKLAKVQGNTLYKTYKLLAAYLTIFWIGYPITWFIGPSGIALVSQRVDTYLFIILPMFSKVGFGLLTLYKLRKISS